MSDNRIVRLITSEDLTRFDGAWIIVEGILTGPDRLKVEWLGQPAIS
ncbi:DUF5818 domain-containing protein [Novosphingobium sp.]